MKLAPGSVIGGYRIEALHASGGMGEVYRATHVALGRRVALKVIRAAVADEPEYRERFTREATVAANLDHPHIVSPHDLGEHEHRLYLVMPFIDGVDLGRLIARDGPLNPARAAGIVAQVADALDAAHAAGLVHRDVKPANILVVDARRSDRALLTDFGIARRAASETRLTAVGRVAGTPGYAAPELVKGEAVDARTDVYALGCVVYEILTGSVPYPRESPEMMLVAHIIDPVPSLADRRDGLPDGLDDVIRRALAKAPNDRFASAGVLAAALRVALSPDPVRRPATIGAASAERVVETPRRSRVATMGLHIVAHVVEDNPISRVVFSPDGSLIATGCADGTVGLWDSTSGEARARLDLGHWPSSLAFSPDGTLIAACGVIGVALVWESASGDLHARLPHGGRVKVVAFTSSTATRCSM